MAQAWEKNDEERAASYSATSKGDGKGKGKGKGKGASEKGKGGNRKERRGNAPQFYTNTVGVAPYAEKHHNTNPLVAHAKAKKMAPANPIHPSWAAKQALKEKEGSGGSIVAFQGKKMTFD
jgi:hypothetical protein